MKKRWAITENILECVPKALGRRQDQTNLTVYLKGYVEPWTGVVLAAPGQVEHDLFVAAQQDKFVFFEMASETARVFFRGGSIVGWLISGDGLPNEPNLSLNAGT